MGNIEAFLVLAIVYFIGEFVGTISKAWIPSVFVTACLFLVGYWTFFPPDIVELAGMGPPLGGTLAIMFCIAHMGTIISIKQLLEQWKIIIITLAGLAGMVILCLLIATMFVKREFIISGLPPLTGGIVAATMMQSAAEAKGLTQAGVIAIAMYAVQGFVGYPLTAIALKKEGKKLLNDFRSGKVTQTQSTTVDNDTGNVKVDDKPRFAIFPQIPDKFVTTALILAKLMFVAWLASLLSKATGGKVHSAVIVLILSIILTELGFLDKGSLQKAGSYGFLMFLLMIYVFAGLKSATPEMLLESIGPMAIIIIIGVIGMAVFSIVVGKILKVSWTMAFATSLTALYGFPPNYILTEESVKSLAKTPEEKKYLMDQMLPQMLVGGFVTVTITSVIIAGIFVNLL